jgi:S1-C subfamily serine protease
MGLMKLRMLMSLGLLAGIAGAVPMLAQAQQKQADRGEAQGDQALVDFSRASRALYRKVSRGLVRVRMENAGLSPQMLKEFEEWRRAQGAAGRAPRESRADRRAESPSTMPARVPGPGQAGLRRFLELKLKEAPDGEARGHIAALIARIDAARNGQANEVIGVVIDDQGHALVAWSREDAGTTFRVLAADGTEMGAKYIGAHLARGFAVIKLDSLGAQTPLAMAPGRPAAGELLMCLTAHQGAVGWVTAPGEPAAAVSATPAGSAGSAGSSTAAKMLDDRFPISSSDDRGTSYLFNTDGELAALGTGKFALPIGTIQQDIQWIIDNNKDISPRALGVSYNGVSAEIRRKIPALGNRPAALVTEVAKGSPAEKAGLKKDDIVVSIDDVSIALLPKIQADLATRTGTVPLEIFRAGTEMTLELPLGEK